MFLAFKEILVIHVALEYKSLKTLVIIMHYILLKTFELILYCHSTLFSSLSLAICYKLGNVMLSW